LPRGRLGIGRSRVDGNHCGAGGRVSILAGVNRPRRESIGSRVGHEGFLSASVLVPGFSFPNSCLGTHARETLFRVSGRNRVSGNPVPKQEFGNEKAAPFHFTSAGRRWFQYWIRFS